MKPLTAAGALALVLLMSACGEQVTDPTAGAGVMAKKGGPGGPSDPTATWKIPLAGAGLALQSDGEQGDGTSSLYAHGTCAVSTRIFATTAGSNSGDATIQLGTPNGRKCGRLFRISYPGGDTDEVAAFANLNQLQSTTFSIPVGNTALRRLILNPGTATCGRVIFGANGTVGAGSDSVQVTRVDASTWQVESQVGADLAWCENTGQTYSAPVSFIISSSTPLP